MRMIPSSPSSRASNAERKVFYALKGSGISDDTVCLHSLGLPRHAYKTCCELDFVLVGPDGLFALEVKGGGVRRNAQGNWTVTDRYGQEHRHREGPFQQVQGNMYALLELLRRRFPTADFDDLPKGWGVVLPDCVFDVKCVEWDDATIADQRRMGLFPVWLGNFVRYYRRKAGRNAAYRAPSDLLRRITEALRPEFEKVPSLAGAIDTVEMTLNSLTDDQCRAVDILVANQRVLCSGGAGTGKTFLAMELARRALADDRTVILCCSSPWLRNFLDARLSHPALQVLAISQARRNILQPPRADLMIVDEGQDLMNLNDLDVLDKLLQGGLSRGRWSFFYDSNNQAGLVGCWDPDSLELLDSNGAAHVPLVRNCRNTRPIVEEVERRTGCDMGQKEQGEGPMVEVVQVDASEPAENKASRAIGRLLAAGVPMSHITLLSPLSWSESCASRLPRHVKRDVGQVDEFSLRTFPPAQISFARIQDFKGLENTAIVLLDLDHRHLDRSAPSLLYVGMSRARAYLALVVNP
ncbi:MAG: DUF2075 domain-containing protein [Planctomycetes bacterium]|nr:DUF2075 domain-containing protein [Planctomycetota bacterium]